jgi:potassium-transporting ATPase potassium-binding subunit
MQASGLVQIGLFLAVLLLLVKPLGAYMAAVYDGRARWLAPVERLIYRLLGTSETEGMSWRSYATAMLAFNLLGLLAVYLLQRMQGWLPLNPQALGAVSPELAFNTAVSFASNTNWQAYGGEVTLSYLTQMLGLNTQNFVSAATGIAVLVALIRGLRARQTHDLGNFWVDLTRSTLYILLPLSLVLALALTSQGVVQSFDPATRATLTQPQTMADGTVIREQVLPLGPAASQIAIKQLGTNGGGFFNVNSAHPFENPTPLSNFLQMLAILLIPAALCYTFGRMLGDTRQGWAVLAAMCVIFVPLLLVTYSAEMAGTPLLTAAGVAPGSGNMEGKELRFGIANSALWAAATTAASNGSVNSMHASFTPIGGLVPMWLIQLGEVIFGGVGSGLYGMLIFAIIAVFVSGLMVGRTPEYLGKKIEAFEMKMASVVILVPPMLVLLGTAIAVLIPEGLASILNKVPAAHGFSEILYAFSSAGNNNGSAFAGLNANTPFYNLALGVAMLFGRYWVAIPVLAIAGSMAGKKTAPAGAGTLPTHTPLFVVMLVSVVIAVGALTFIPALALGPVVEALAQ